MEGEPLSCQQDLEIEDILQKLQEVTKPLPDFILESKDLSEHVQEFHQRLVTGLDSARFETMKNTLASQCDQDESILYQKATNVEQLVLRLQIDEMNEMQRAHALGIL